MALTPQEALALAKRYLGQGDMSKYSDYLGIAAEGKDPEALIMLGEEALSMDNSAAVVACARQLSDLTIPAGLESRYVRLSTISLAYDINDKIGTTDFEKHLELCEQGARAVEANGGDGRCAYVLAQAFKKMDLPDAHEKYLTYLKLARAGEYPLSDEDNKALAKSGDASVTDIEIKRDLDRAFEQCAPGLGKLEYIFAQSISQEMAEILMQDYIKASVSKLNGITPTQVRLTYRGVFEAIYSATYGVVNFESHTTSGSGDYSTRTNFTGRQPVQSNFQGIGHSEVSTVTPKFNMQSFIKQGKKPVFTKDFPKSGEFILPQTFDEKFKLKNKLKSTSDVAFRNINQNIENAANRYIHGTVDFINIIESDRKLTSENVVFIPIFEFTYELEGKKYIYLLNGANEEIVPAGKDSKKAARQSETQEFIPAKALKAIKICAVLVLAFFAVMSIMDTIVSVRIMGGIYNEVMIRVARNLAVAGVGSTLAIRKSNNTVALCIIGICVILAFVWLPPVGTTISTFLHP